MQKEVEKRKSEMESSKEAYMVPPCFAEINSGWSGQLSLGDDKGHVSV